MFHVSRGRGPAPVMPASLRPLMVLSFLLAAAMALRVDYIGIWLVRDLHAAPDALGAAYVANAALEVTFSLVAGRLCDRLGTRPLLVVGALGTTLVAGLLLVVRDNVILGLVLLAAGGGADAVGWVAINVAVSHAVPDGGLERAYATRQIVNSAAFVLSPLCAAFLLSYGWTYVWGLGAAAGLLAALMGSRSESVPPAAVTAGPEGGRKRDHFRLFGNTTFLLLFIGISMSYMVFFMYEISLPVALGGERIVTPRVAGFLYVVNPVAIILSQRVVTSLASRLNDRTKLMLGTACMALPSLGLLAGSIPVVFVVLAVVALGEALWGPVSAAVSARAAPPDRRGTYLAGLGTSYSLGIGLAPGIGLGLYRGHGSSGLTTGILAAGLIAAASYFWVTRFPLHSAHGSACERGCEESIA